MINIPNSNPWIVIPKRRTSPRLRLFCIPYAGGSSTVFRSWPDAFAPEIEAAFIQLPGRGSRFRETPLTRVHSAVEMLNSAIEPYLDCPYVIFGHSLGALIGFELARELRRRQQPNPQHIIVCARAAPHLPNELTTVHHLSDDLLVREVQRRYGGIPQAILADSEMLQLFLPVLRADLEMLETYQYRPEPPLSYDMTAYGGIQDRAVTNGQLAAWANHTTGRFTQQMFPGNHFFVQNTPMFLETVISLLASIGQ
jgi:surfactin synthase thioesterase subunit